MKRRSFITTSLSAVPVSLGQIFSTLERPKKGIKVDAGKDRFNKSFNFLGAQFDLKVSGKDCDGNMSIFDTVRREKRGPILHSHTDLDEWFFVLEGDFKIQVGDETFRTKPGDSVFGPRNIPHAFVKTSEGPGRIIIMHAPAGTMEEYFAKAIELKDPTMEERQALARQHNMIPMGPPLSAD
jgi:mannose-6-phosphate isomerase-like protein (cupin superfamily)